MSFKNFSSSKSAQSNIKPTDKPVNAPATNPPAAKPGAASAGAKPAPKS